VFSVDEERTFDIDASQFANQPFTKQAIKSLILAPNLPSIINGYFRAEQKAQTFLYHQIVADGRFSKNIQWLTDLLEILANLVDDYRLMYVLGGKTLTTFKAHNETVEKFSAVALQLFADIEQSTMDLFLSTTPHHRFCPYCLHYYTRNVVSLSNQSEYTYYGCRVCGESQPTEPIIKTMVALLDIQSDPLIHHQHTDTIYINWSKQKKLFDFDSVEILSATDLEVEKFATQIGNDTDEIRQATYQTMRCAIASACHLSENTLRILRKMFGSVDTI
ncbi:MAG: hypothetical protein AAF485_11400, partial [Chloroflexota bacterium]